MERAAPWLFCVGLFLLVTGPVLFNPRLQLYYRDTGRLYYPVRKYIADRLSRGEFPLWYPWSEAGLSILGQLSPGLLHPFTLLYLVMPFDLAFKLHHLLPLPLAGIGTYLLARQLAASRPAAVLAGIGYGGCGYLVSMAASNLPYVVGPATMPWALWGFLRFLEVRTRRRLLVAALLLGSCVLAGEPQSALLAGLIGGAWTVTRGLLGGESAPWRARLRGTARGAAWAGVWAIASLCIAAPAALPAIPRIQASARTAGHTADERESFYVSPYRLPGYVLPFAFDDFELPSPESPTGSISYFAEYFQVGTRAGFADSIYLGLPILLLAVAGLIGSRRGLFLALGGLLFATGSCGMALGISEVLGSIFPVLGLFRYTEKYAATTALLLALAAALGLDSSLAERGRTTGLALAAILLGVGLILLRGWIGSRVPQLSASLIDAGRTHRSAFAQPFLGALMASLLTGTALLLALGMSASLWLWRSRLRALSPWLLAACAAASSLACTSNLIFAANAELFHSPPALATRLLAEEGPSEGRWRYYLDDQGAYNYPTVASDDARFRAATAGSLGLHPHFEGLFGIEGLRSYFSLDDIAFDTTMAASMPNMAVLLDVRVVALTPGRTSLREAAKVGFLPSEFGYLVRKNPHRPRAFLVDQLIWARDPARATAMFGFRLFDVASQAIVVKADQARAGDIQHVPGAPPGQAVLRRPRPETFAIEVSNPSARLLVVSEHFDPGWSARIDGQAAPVIRVDNAVLGVPVGAGNHLVELSFWPTGLTAGLTLTAVCVACLLAPWTRITRRILSPRVTLPVTMAHRVVQVLEQRKA